MLKININKKTSSLPDHIEEGLSPHIGFLSIKETIWVSTFLLLDVPLAWPVYILFQSSPLLFYSFLLPLVGLHIWAFRLLIKNKKNTQMEFLLYIGFLGLIGSFLLTLLILIIQFYIGLTSPFYLLILFLHYLFSIYLFFIAEHKKYSSFNIPKRKKIPHLYWYVTYITPLTLCILANFIMGPYPAFLFGLISFFIFWTFAIVFILFMTNSFHRYFFIKQNIYHVRFANKALNRKYRELKKAEQQAEKERSSIR
ncbi:hypothetical protein CJ195_24035 [Bacillus sp. UMB0899]|nr:hypothetical protein CJ195_24035 [Bacillus sp. UMB0899]